MRMDMDKAKKLLPALQRAALALSRIDADTEPDATRAQA
jgi:IclR family acetate operon transcriptional repressor